jgi:hypothetical protein
VAAERVAEVEAESLEKVVESLEKLIVEEKVNKYI